jgi:hypothetical protein
VRELISILIEVLMSCPLCVSSNHAKFTAEVVIHFSGLKNLDRLGIFVFPKPMVCLDCGVAGFTIAQRELRPLRKFGATVCGSLAAST